MEWDPMSKHRNLETIGSWKRREGGPWETGGKDTLQSKDIQNH